MQCRWTSGKYARRQFAICLAITNSSSPRPLAARWMHGEGKPAHEEDVSSFSIHPSKQGHFRCTIQYDGSQFHGWQTQVSLGVRTVQGVIEDALTQLNRGDRVHVTAAGRTDKGVHASGQVINFKLPWWQHGRDTMMKALNANLPVDVSVVHSEVVDPSFHARYSASYRRYCYTIYNAPHRSPLFLRYAWHVPQKLNIEQMQAAASLLVGSHDFSTFGTPPDEMGHCIREIISISIKRTPVPSAGPSPFADSPSSAPTSASTAYTCVADVAVPPSSCNSPVSTASAQMQTDSISPGSKMQMATDASIISIDIVGRSFLYHMVRNIVGTLLLVGCGKDTPNSTQERLLRRSRVACPKPAPAHGLTLTEVGYWGEDGGLSFDAWHRNHPREDIFGDPLMRWPVMGPPRPFRGKLGGRFNGAS